MTPKQMASYLVNKYWNLAPTGYDRMPLYSYAKQCAIIAIDVILDGQNLIRTPLTYWQQVKEEIEKL